MNTWCSVRWSIVVLVWSLAAVLGCQRRDAQLMRERAVVSVTAPSAVAPVERIYSERAYIKPSDVDLKARLEPLEYAVTQRAATEPAFHNRYFDQHAEGL